jgi:RPA family protein
MVMTMVQYERQNAYITTIAALLSSTFVKGEAQMQPSYAATKDGKKISRAHLMAVIVTLPEGMISEATIDDGTGKIVARSFEDPQFFSHVQLGDVVRVIGKVREFNEQTYLIPEIVKKIGDKQWVKFHRLLLQQQSTVDVVPEVREEIRNETVSEETIEDLPIDADETQESSPAEDVLAIIKELDTGDGTQIEVVIAKQGDDAEKIIQNLLESGEIFEIRPGRVKLLE